MTVQDRVTRHLDEENPRHIAVTAARHSAGASDENRRNRDHGAVTPDERALSSWSFLNQVFFNRAFDASFLNFCP
jgi:hypothetical protein